MRCAVVVAHFLPWRCGHLPLARHQLGLAKQPGPRPSPGHEYVRDVVVSALAGRPVALLLYEELPYAAAVETENWEDRPDGSTIIHQQILIERDSQKGIVVGKGGSRLKAIGAAARAAIAEHLGRQVHLYLHVKVAPKWGEDRSLYKEFGLEWSE